MADVSENLGLPRNASSERTAGILLVGDNPADLRSLREILAEWGQSLVVARSSGEAIEQVQTTEFAVVLIDIMMPTFGGFETAKLLRRQDRACHTPVIFLAANRLERSRLEEGYALGAVDFVIKPYLPLALQAKVRGFIELFLDKQRAKQEADQLRLLVHGTTEYAICMLDPEGRVLTWNAGAERLKGYRAEEIVGQRFFRFYPQEAIDRGWPEHVLRVALAEGRFEDEGWRVRKDGTQFWANVVITALRDEQGQLRGFSKVTRDLTERRQTRERLRSIEERFRLLIETATDYAIFLLDPHGNVASWNAGAERIKQYKSDEIIGQHFARFYPQEAIDRGWPEHELKVAKAEGRFEDEGWRVRKDGTRFWANVVITALYDESGTFRGFSKITRDLTERKKSEENARRLVEEATARRLAEENTRLIQEQRERLRVTLASIGDGVISTDAQGRVDFLNPTAQHLVGWTNEDAAGKDLTEVFRIVNEDTRQTVENPALRALREGVIVGLANHTVLLAKDGAEYPIDDSAAPIRDTKGNVIGSVLVFRDVSEQRRAAQASRKNQELLQLIHKIGKIGHWEWNSLTDENRWSPEIEALYGLAPGGFKGGYQEWANLVHPDDLPRTEADIQRALETGEYFSEFRVIWPDGSVHWLETRAHVFKDDADGAIRIMGVNMDITERKHQEESRQESEQRFRNLADAMPQIVWTARPDGEIDYLNRRWYEFTGLAETTGLEGWRQILHPDDAAPAAKRWAASLRTGAPFEMEVRLLDRRRQSYRWHLIRTVAAQDSSGAVIHWFGTSTDIDGQKRAEESSRFLAEASAALAGVVDYESTLQKVANLAVPYFADWSAVDVANGAGTLRRLAVAHQDADKVNLAHELIRQYPPDPQSPTGALAVLRTGKSEIVSEITDEMLVLATRDQRHLDLIRSLGLRSYICVPLVVSGELLGVLTFATAESGRTYTDSDLALANDLANRAGVAIENFRLYQALRDTDRRKDEFLATLAHELRNPLAPIRNSLQILKMSRNDAEIVEQAREIMERQVHHLVRLVDDLLDVSRVMRGKIELRKERIELATVLAGAVETVQPLVDAQGHELCVRLPKESLWLDADPVRVAQIVGNLLTNAAKYTEADGRIWLTAEREGDVAVLRVRDNGIGIAPNMLPRIFDLFVQVDHASTKAQGGLGIGLTLVKNLVQMHEGTVEAISGGLSQGSEFVVRLPLSVPAAQQARGPSQSPSQSQSQSQSGQSQQRPTPAGHRVLIVDDNQDAANSLAMLLKLQGHEVRVAHDGPAALEIARQYVPEVVFLDIGMPRMDGYEVARRLRQLPGLESVVLAALTGWGQQQDRRRTTEAGFNHHLVKPPEPKTVEAVLADLKRNNA